MRYQIDAWLDDGNPHLKITDADSGAVRLQWIYRRETESEPGCSGGTPCAGCSALHRLINHLFLIACADGRCASRAHHPAKEAPEASQKKYGSTHSTHNRSR
ncbi:MAG: hypothetical protein IT488_09685 [Gammaproteobacteria bacterium]|nr:hypothetical protein [Gammaproteobacteria bacterium]